MPEADFPSPPEDRTGWPWSAPALRSRNQSSGLRITLITPSFNQGAFLEETIRSVLLQSHENLEYFVVDGGSTDDSLEIIRKYEPWISWWVSERDRGQADAINKGFARATGDLVGWLNSDDVLCPNFLHNRAAEFEERADIDLIYGDVAVGEDNIPNSEVMMGRDIDFATMVRTLEVPIPQQSALWRREVLDRVGGLDPRWHVVLDREFFLRVARHCTLAYRPGITGLFRRHPDAKSEAQQLSWVDELPLLYAQLFADPDLPPAIACLEEESLTVMDRLCAQLLWRHHRFGAWADHVFRAFRRSPGHFYRLFLRDVVRSKIRGAVRRFPPDIRRGNRA